MLEYVKSTLVTLAESAGIPGALANGGLLSFVLCDQAVIVPCFTLSWQRVHTQRKKVGSLLSSCWQLEKLCPFTVWALRHSLGWTRSFFVGFGRGTPSLCIPLQWKKKRLLLQSCLLCTKQHKLGWTPKKCTSAQFKLHSLWKNILLLSLVFGFTHVNLDKKTVSLCWQHECMPPGKGKGKAIWIAASRLETVEAVATTTANHKNAH